MTLTPVAGCGRPGARSRGPPARTVLHRPQSCVQNRGRSHGRCAERVRSVRGPCGRVTTRADLSRRGRRSRGDWPVRPMASTSQDGAERRHAHGSRSGPIRPWHHRIQRQLAVDGVQPEHRPQEHQRRRRGPGLRAARGRVRHGEARHRPVVAGERLGQPVPECAAASIMRHRDPVGLLAVAVPGQAERDDRVVVRPDRADVVADRVVTRCPVWTVSARPSRRTSRATSAGRTTSATRSSGTMPLHSRWPMLEVMRVDLALVAVQADGVVAAPLVDPEVPIEPLPQRAPPRRAAARPAPGRASGPSASSATRSFAS